jgi:hypothetical protein
MPPRKKFLLRISPALWDELNRWAAREFRSVNGQIEFLLQRAVDERRGRRRGEDEEGRDADRSGAPAP